MIQIHINGMIQSLADTELRGDQLFAQLGIEPTDQLFREVRGDDSDEEIMFDTPKIIIRSNDFFYSVGPALTCEGPLVDVTIDTQPFQLPTKCCGFHIKAMGGRDAQYQLFRESSGSHTPDEMIPDREAIMLRAGDSFYSVPPATFGNQPTTRRSLCLGNAS